MEGRNTRLLVACSGSVATIKLKELLQLLDATTLFDIQVILTKASTHFLDSDLKSIQERFKVHFDEQQWEWKKRGDPVPHIQLRKWADMLLIAPLSAHTMAKIVFGLCDNLLSLVVRCWNFNNKVNNSLKNPIVVCPAMNTLMYENPLTTEQIDVLKHRGITVLGPVQKTLVCGQKGNGAMEEVNVIVDFVANIAKSIPLTFKTTDA